MPHIFDNMIKTPFLQRYVAEKITLQKMAGSISRLSSVLAKATIELNPYQISAALYAFNSPLQRGAILADEVGLGKTIEAGIIVSQLWAEGKRRILIIAPASLRKQWQDELSNKFGLNSEVYDGPSFIEKINNGEKIPLTYEGIFIVSYQFAYARVGLIEKQSWNAVFIDEAHRMRRAYRGRDASKMAYEIRKIISDKPKVLLTATPLQNNLMELYGIASFIDDKLLGTPYSFKTRFVDPLSEINESNKGKLKELRLLIKGEESNDPMSVSGILIRTLRKEVLEYVRFTNRKSMTFDFTPSYQEVELYEKVSLYLQRDEVAAINTTQRNLMILVYRKLLASSSFAIAGTLKKLIESLEKELKLRVKEEESRTKPEIAPEEAEDEGIEEEVEDADVEMSEQPAKAEKPRIDTEKFSDEDIQKEIEELKSYYNLAVSIEKNSKGDALISALKSIFNIAKEKGWPQKAVVFTESRRTQEYISGILKDNGIGLTLFNGSNTSPEARKAYERWSKEFPEFASTGSFSANMRQALVYDFEKNSQVLLTTEAGAEGLNLQFCNIVINYDLPWNPQRVEQRIGRCHRYGQRHEVIVANFLNTKNRADRRLLELLQTKLNLFDGLFGSSDEILGALESGIDFEKRILEIYQSCKTPEDIDSAFDVLQESLQSKISDSILKLRSYLTEFDDSVKNLFKKTKFDTESALTEFDNDLLKLCFLALGDGIKKTHIKGIYEVSYNGNKHLIAFRNLNEDEIGKIPRANKEHPVITDIINKSLMIETSPTPSVIFNYSGDKKKISQIEAFLDKDGFIFLFKLRVNGIETEEVLAPLTFIEEKKAYKPIDLPTANQILTLNVLHDNPSTPGISELPFSKEELLSCWNNWKSQALEIYQKKNERLYDREIDRINRYYQDYALKVDDKINKLEKELAELNRKRDNSADLAERRDLHKKIQKAELDIDKLRIEQIKLKEEAFTKKQKDLEGLDVKFGIKTEEKLIAVTHFRII
jgi:ERCC4-related helicase